jgi:release factor glutamine methyltransferase
MNGSASDERDEIERAIRDGRVEFMGLELRVARGALVPRRETELLARAALAALPDGASSRVIDMCCGAGNLACALAHQAPQARVWACDLTDACVELARTNAQNLGLAGRVAVHQGDLFGALAGLGLEGTIDTVVCNPPYISDKRLAEDRAVLLDNEPAEAFAAGPYGIAIHQRVVRDALLFLKPGGTLLFEIGVGQQRQVELLFRRAKSYDRVVALCNAEGEPRVVSGRRIQPTAVEGEPS